MKKAKTLITIRPYQPEDRKGVIEIIHRTGYMGEDAKKYFDDKYLLALLFGIYYLDYEPESCFVALEKTTEDVVGYILSSLDTKIQTRIFKRRMIPKIAIRTFLYTSWRYNRSFRVLLHIILDPEPPHDKLNLTDYPAHLHINVLPKYHRQGIGTKLINKLEEYLEKGKCKGIHLWTSERNVKALPFYLKKGFKLLYTSPPGYGLWPNAKDAKSLLFGKKFSIDED
ncbi:MAG: GNAT family N-acetyltransferase [Candidatus Hodarchaeales archaeon]